MNTFSFSEECLYILRNAGWDENRTVDTGVYERALANESYPLHPEVLRFLSVFGGLQVQIEGPEGTEDFAIDPITAIESVYKERVLEEYSERAEALLCVVGLYHHGHLVLMMDAQGRVFGGYDETFLRIGETGEEAIECMCRGLRGR